MWQHFKIFVIQFAAIAAVRLFDMGLAWTQGELGFHPMAAGAMAIILLLFPHIASETVDEEF